MSIFSNFGNPSFMFSQMYASSPAAVLNPRGQVLYPMASSDEILKTCFRLFWAKLSSKTFAGTFEQL